MKREQNAQKYGVRKEPPGAKGEGGEMQIIFFLLISSLPAFLPLYHT